MQPSSTSPTALALSASVLPSSFLPPPALRSVHFRRRFSRGPLRDLRNPAGTLAETSQLPLDILAEADFPPLSRRQLPSIDAQPVELWEGGQSTGTAASF
ncbi:hypothetical protein VTH06DRAFT_5077 [Thermothelomyces fergusii]